MVDATKGIGPIQNLPSTANKSHGGGSAKAAKESRAPRDEVSLSEEALSLQQAEKSAAEARAQLEGSDLTLGLDRDFADKEIAS